MNIRSRYGPYVSDTHRLPSPSPDWALFLDFDGTLVEIADRPTDVRVPDRVPALLDRLRRALRGAVALVSGRSIAELDRLFAPLHLPAAGQHGLEWRGANGTVQQASVPGDALARARVAMDQLTPDHPNLLVEDKGLSLAVHFRQAPAAEPRVRAILDGIAAATDGRFHVQTGKMILELKPAAAGKGTVVERFLEESPFRARTPVFLGDDVTDEDGFAIAQRHGGFGVRIGPAEGTAAAYTLPTVSTALAWLEAIADTLDPPSSDGAA